VSDLKPDRQRRDLHKSNLPTTSWKIGSILITASPLLCPIGPRFGVVSSGTFYSCFSQLSWVESLVVQFACLEYMTVVLGLFSR
jgi:hypothetical protein